MSKVAELFGSTEVTTDAKPKVKATLSEDGKGNYVLTFPKHLPVSMIRTTENGNPFVAIHGPSMDLCFTGEAPDGNGGTRQVKDATLETSAINFRLNL